MTSYILNIYRNVSTFHVYLLCILLGLFGLINASILSEELADTTAPQTNFFFGDNKNYEKNNDIEMDKSFSGEEESSGHEEESHGGQDQWVNEDISPLFPELSILDELGTKKSLKRMKKARRFYSHSKHVIKIVKSDVELENKKFSLEGVRYKWEKIDRKEGLNRRIRRIETRGRMEAVNNLIKGIRELDMIKNPVILNSDSYVTLKSNFYREYVKHQFRSRNLHLCVDILKRYLAIKASHQQEPEAHRLLAACYRHQEILAKRARDNKTVLKFKTLKNDHLKKYALLAFGKDSEQYKFIKNKIDKDMMQVVPIT